MCKKWMRVWFFLSLAASAQAASLNVVATTGMIADIVKIVGGDAVQVETLIPTGVDPHGFTPGRGDVVRLRRAEVIFYNGLLLEGRMSDLLARMGRQGRVTVVAVADELRDTEAYAAAKDDEGEWDPHLWMDVGAWREAVAVVERVLSAKRPAEAMVFATNARAYREELDALDAYVRSIVATIPEERRVLVTAHDAFGYFGRAYGLEVRGIQGISTESEPGVRDLENLIAFVVRRQVPAIFLETSVPDRNARALIEGARAQGHQVRIGGRLFSDSMGMPGTYTGTYLGMIDHNATTIVRSLGGEAPERGRLGKLELP